MFPCLVGSHEAVNKVLRFGIFDGLGKELVVNVL
jgi:hypothetical protein